ncbi:MAG TPA: SGNH/GDSL hydrolase family protein [Nocardioidaceae bacterium]|nr:SGNH/GDSL hydrolase family protein [Nocardioidaceae bacterium]
MRRVELVRLVVAALVGSLVLLGCSAGADTVDDVKRQTQDFADAASPRFGKYVALGDSYTAAPLVPNTDLANGCFRSDNNYPHLVADQLDIDKLVDVSCSGAETGDLTHRQHTVGDATVRPQLAAVTRDTDLVTLGIGGNDFDLFHTLVATCSRLRREDPAGSPCARTLAARGVRLVAETRQISARVERSVRMIQRRAPKATVVLVGYLRLVPTTGRCPGLAFAQGDYAFGTRVSTALNAAIERAARRTGSRFVDMYAASAGHDVCADVPWVNGRQTVQGEALAYHPFAAGQDAVAEELVKVLG